MSWYLNENDILTHADLAEEGGSGFNYPYPATFWSLNNRKVLTLFLLPEPVGGNDVGAWFLDENDILKNVALSNELIFGSFYKCPSLIQMSIPISVKHIGEHAFEGSSLEEVTIASDCVYYPNSFPSGCTINFYEEE